MNIQQAVNDFHANGYLIIQDVINPANIEVLRNAKLSEDEKILEPKKNPFDFKNGKNQQAPPPTPPLHWTLHWKPKTSISPQNRSIRPQR